MSKSQTPNTIKLKHLMVVYDVSAKEVAELLGRSKKTVLEWRSSSHQHIPDWMLELLEYKLTAKGKPV